MFPGVLVAPHGGDLEWTTRPDRSLKDIIRVSVNQDWTTQVGEECVSTTMGAPEAPIVVVWVRLEKVHCSASARRGSSSQPFRRVMYTVPDAISERAAMAAESISAS